MFGGLLKLGNTWLEQQKPLKVNLSKCTHTRHKSSTCNACVDVCPENAISLQDGLQVDWSCNGCGLCTSVCPTEAIELREQSNKEIYTNIKHQAEENEQLFFQCELAISKGINNGIKLSCLGQIDDLAIQLSIAYGVKEFNFLTDYCQNCTLESGYKLFEVRLAKWKEMWPEVKWNEVNKQTYLSYAQNNETNKTNGIDRRAFFKVIGNETKNIVMESVKPTAKEETPWRNGELVAQDSIRLQVREKWIKSKMGSNDNFIAQVLEVTDSCITCGICEKVCPTDAIEMDDKNGKPIWNAEHCVNCNLCVDVCYRNALKWKKA